MTMENKYRTNIWKFRQLSMGYFSPTFNGETRVRIIFWDPILTSMLTLQSCLKVHHLYLPPSSEKFGIGKVWLSFGKLAGCVLKETPIRPHQTSLRILLIPKPRDGESRPLVWNLTKMVGKLGLLACWAGPDRKTWACIKGLIFTNSYLHWKTLLEAILSISGPSRLEKWIRLQILYWKWYG